MADQRKDGGTFHPVYSRPWTPSGGITLRDWFAGQSIIGMMSCAAWADRPNAEIAADAYDLADAMIAESARAKGGGG